MKNLGILAIAAITALVLGVASFGTKGAQAEVDDTRAVWCGFLVDALGGEACNGLSATDIANLDDELGDGDGQLEPSELDDVDLDANQITDAGPGVLDEIYIIAFVDDDEEVTFDAETGVTVTVLVDTDGSDSPNTDANAEVCTAEDDADCDSDDIDDGDGVVVARINDGTADAGDDVSVEIFQADDTNQRSEEVLTVVGLPDDVAASAVLDKDTVQTDTGDCGDDADVTDAGQIGDVDKTFVQAVVTDNDGTELTRITIAFSSSDDDVAFVADDTAVTVDAGDVGIAAFAVICGGDETGTATIEADEAIDDEQSTVEITVVGEPAAVALTASPAAINCDGVTSSTVTATVTDSEGNNVANGTGVNFSVVALGVADPINTSTAGGVATSEITPLAGGIAGVTVIVTSGDAQASIRVDCNPSAATPTVPGATPTPPGGVTPPDTGNGGYLGQDSSAGFPMWTLLALALGAVALVGGGVVTRRITK